MVASAALTGSVVPTATEVEVVAGAKTLIITLTNARWAETLGADNSITQDLIDGINAGTSPANGWNLVVRDFLTFSDVTRNGDLTCTILFPAFGSYDIQFNETITVTLEVSTHTDGPTIGGDDPVTGDDLKLTTGIGDIKLIAVVNTNLDAAPGLTETPALTVTMPVIVDTNTNLDAGDGGLTETVALVPGLTSASVLAVDATLIDQSNRTVDDSQLALDGVNWEAQTFTPGANHNLNRVWLLLRRGGSGALPGTCTVSIRNTSAGLPSGADLQSVTFSGDDLKVDPVDADWRYFVLTDVALTASTLYAIVVRAPSGDSNNRLLWRIDAGSPLYTGGQRCFSSDSGSSWTADSTTDTMFEEGEDFS